MKRFQKTIEDFVCQHCGFEVQGNGYTNHCPQCLYSKHVDIHPGDRAELCRGMMQPIQIISKGGSPALIIHRCQVCQEELRTKLSQDDSMQTVIEVMKTFATKKAKE